MRLGKMPTTKTLHLRSSQSLSLSSPPPIIRYNSYFLPTNTRFCKIRYSSTNSFNYISSNPSVVHLHYSRFLSLPIRAAASSAPLNDGEAKDSGGLLNWAQPLIEFTSSNFLPLALIGGVILGLADPRLGCLADKYYMSKVCTCGIFMISGLTLRSQEIGAAIKAWPVGVFGLVSIMLLTPAFARLLLLLNLQPKEFITGLAIFTCMPTTLSSGVSLTQLAGGNFALALFMNVISNSLGILVVPFTITKFVAAGVGIAIPTTQLFKSLIMVVVIPLILGKMCRELFNSVGDFSDKNRKLLSKLNALFLCLIPWMQVSKSKSLLLKVNPTCFLLAIGLGVLLHFTLLAFNALAIKVISSITGGSKSIFSNKQNAIALLLCASQKTVVVMIAVVDQLGGAMGDPGLLIIPCVAAHLNQTILDSFLVNYFFQRDPHVH